MGLLVKGGWLQGVSLYEPLKVEKFFQLKTEEEAERFGLWWALHLPLVQGTRGKHETECQHYLGAKTGPS